MATGFAGRIEPVKIDHLFTFLFGQVFQNSQELAKGQVGHLAAPQPLHPFEVERFKEQDVVAVGQFVGLLEEPVSALVRNLFVCLGQQPFGLLAIMRPCLLFGQVAVGLSEVIQRLLEKLGRVYGVGFKPVVDGQEGLETKVKARHFTGRGFELRGRHFLRQTQIQLAQPIALNRYRA